MSNKLSAQDQRSSEDAIYYFKMECTSPDIFKTRVQVVDRDNCNIVDNDSITIRVVQQYAWQEIPIMWEDAGLTRTGFNKLGLYGIYSTSYYKMEFLDSTKQLKIYSNDSNLIILIDAK